MTRTKNMIIKDSVESRELELYAENDSTLYFGIYSAVIGNLIKKKEKGTYDKERAIDAFYHVATEASNRYKKDFGYAFDVTARFFGSN